MMDRGEREGSINYGSLPPFRDLDNDADHEFVRRARNRRARIFCAIEVGCAVACSVGVATAAFLLLFFVALEPEREAMDRMGRASCTILNHTLIGTRRTEKGDDDDDRRMFLPGLGVKFRAGNEGKDHMIVAVARPRLHDSDSWMDGARVDAYFKGHPVGSVSACYYARARPAAMVVMDPSSYAYARALVLCIVVPAVILVATACWFGCYALSDCQRYRRYGRLEDVLTL